MLLQFVKILAFKIHIFKYIYFNMNLAANERCQFPGLTSIETW